MILFFVFLGMVLAVLSFLLIPMLRAPAIAATRMDYDVLVYRDQLAEVERDVARGMLPNDQADAVRTEIYRRAKAAEDAQKNLGMAHGSTSGRWVSIFAILLLVPLGSGYAYLCLGSPQLPDRPFASRAHEPQFIMAAAAAKLAAQLEKMPNAESYSQLGALDFVLHDFDQSVAAYRNALKIRPKDAHVWSGLGESLTFSQNAMVTPEARDAFVKALHLDPHDFRARFYLGLASLQTGDPRHAIAVWRDLLQDSPPDAVWRPMIQEQMADITKKTGIDPETVTPQPPSLAPPVNAGTIMEMDTADQNAAIHKMVDRLAARLQDHPDDLEGWQRLAKSYRVLGETDKAEAAEKKIEKLKAGDHP